MNVAEDVVVVVSAVVAVVVVSVDAVVVAAVADLVVTLVLLQMLQLSLNKPQLMNKQTHHNSSIQKTQHRLHQNAINPIPLYKKK